MKKLLKLLLLLAVPLCLLLHPVSGLAAEQGNSAKVVLQLKWTHLFQFAGYYAALEKGYYREAGLDVSFLEAGPETNPIPVVLSGKAHFGISTSELLLHRVSGDKVVVLASIFQHSPLAIMTLRDGPVQSIHDLAGRRVMLEPGSAELYAYFRKEYLPRDHMLIMPHSHRIEDLLNRTVDAMSVYDTDEPYTARLAGAEVNLFSARSVGIDFYGDCLFTSEDYIAKNPDTVRKFREASLKGWHYALKNQSEMADLIRARYLPERSKEQLLFEAQKISQLMQADLVEIGYVNPGRWKHIAETYAELGMIPRDVSLDGFIYQQEPSPINKNMILGIVATSLLACLAFLGLARYVKLNRRLSRSEALYRSFLSASPDGIAITDMEMRFLMVSPKALAMFGFEHEKDIIGLKPFDLVIPEDLERAHGNSKLMLKGGTALGPREYRAIKPDGTFIDFEVNTDFVRNSSGLPTSLVMVIREIGDRKRMQEKLELQATTDGLTGLYNRHYIIEKIQAAFETFRRSGEPFSLVIADIDLFKQVNDAFGHNGGDGVLRFVAEELGKESRLCDTIARWGGEEFLFLLPSTDINLAMRIAERVRCRFEGKPFNWEGKQLSISLTFGVVSVYAQDTPESLIDRADQAMYQGKREGRNRVVNGNEMK